MSTKDRVNCTLMKAFTRSHFIGACLLAKYFYYMYYHGYRHKDLGLLTSALKKTSHCIKGFTIAYPRCDGTISHNIALDCAMGLHAQNQAGVKLMDISVPICGVLVTLTLKVEFLPRELETCFPC